jgi:hypothetical protein
MWALSIIFFAKRRLTYTFKAKTPLERAKLLETTILFRNIHAEIAKTGQTAPPENLNVDLHFSCFVEAPDASTRTSESGEYPNRLIELDGARDGPMDHGPVGDFLKVRNRRGILEVVLADRFPLLLPHQ